MIPGTRRPILLGAAVAAAVHPNESKSHLTARVRFPLLASAPFISVVYRRLYLTARNITQFATIIPITLLLLFFDHFRAPTLLAAHARRACMRGEMKM